MSKHTPGPWRVPMIDAESTGILWGNEDRPVAVICGTDATMTANAKLIAAAPDMLAALEGLLIDEDYRCDADWEFARHAIAKAKGQA